MLKLLRDRIHDYNVDEFLNELFEASKLLGVLEAKTYDYNNFSNGVIGVTVPFFKVREFVSSIGIEGIQMTVSDAFEEIVEGSDKFDTDAPYSRNFLDAFLYGIIRLCDDTFSDELIQDLHTILQYGLVAVRSGSRSNKYKQRDNRIVNSVGTTIFIPPSHTETNTYMRDLLEFINNRSDGMNPLIKAAIFHSQFESIHPFDDGNGRVGRLLVGLYLQKTEAACRPFFNVSEAISRDKLVYYNRLNESRMDNYNNWIRFFLQKCVVQANIQIECLESLYKLYTGTYAVVQHVTNAQQSRKIVRCLFTQPIITSKYLASKLGVTQAQAKRYINKLEGANVLSGDDRKRNRRYYFTEFINLANT